MQSRSDIVELGVFSFGETDPHPGARAARARQRLRDLVEEIELADQVELDVFGIGERIGRERGWPPLARDQFEHSRALRGANFVGSPQHCLPCGR
jgi:hypothetical protein